MKKLLLLAALATALIAPARADYLIRDGGGVSQTIRAGVVAIGSPPVNTILPWSTPTDPTGVPYAAANPLPIVFGNGATLPAFSSTPHFICDSGCLQNATIGQAIGSVGTLGGFKDGSGNFQPFLGDVTNGQWVNIKASVSIPITGNVNAAVTQTTIPWVTNTYMLGGVTLAGPSAYGTAPTGQVQGVNAFVTNSFTTGPAALANTLGTNLNSQYPVNSVTTAPTPVGAVATGTTGAVVATMAATASVTNFLCEFDVSIIGGTAAGTVTVAGLNGGSRVYNLTATAAGVLLQKSFSPCIPASAANTAITITTTAYTGATANDVNSSGYRL